MSTRKNFLPKSLFVLMLAAFSILYSCNNTSSKTGSTDSTSSMSTGDSSMKMSDSSSMKMSDTSKMKMGADTTQDTGHKGGQPTPTGH